MNEKLPPDFEIEFCDPRRVNGEPQNPCSAGSFETAFFATLEGPIPQAPSGVAELTPSETCQCCVTSKCTSDKPVLSGTVANHLDLSHDKKPSVASSWSGSPSGLWKCSNVKLILLEPNVLEWLWHLDHQILPSQAM